MKNPDKNIDPSSPERPWQPDKNIPAGSGRLSVIVVRGLGKVHSFEVSPWILALVSLFLILYLITSGVALYDYINTLHINRGQSESLERLQHEIEGTKKELEQSKHRMMILTGHIQDLIDGKEKQTEQIEAKKVIPKKTGQVPEQDTIKKIDEKQAPQTKVGIKDLDIRREDTKLRVSFNVVNLNQDKKRVRGYAHIIVIDQESDPPRVWAPPDMLLKNGIPTDYKLGRLFSIKRFKTVQEEYPLEKMDSPTLINIFIYNQSGDLIFKKDVKMEKRPGNPQTDSITK